MSNLFLVSMVKTRTFYSKRSSKAVDDVHVKTRVDEVLELFSESGCGKEHRSSFNRDVDLTSKQ